MVLLGIIMLPKKYRLKRKNEFSYIFKRGKTIANQYLVLYYAPAKQENENRVGFAVSKKIGNAVIRNRIKRRMREAIRPSLPYIIAGYDLIFIARIKIKGISFKDVEKNMYTLINKVGLMQKHKEND